LNKAYFNFRKPLFEAARKSERNLLGTVLYFDRTDVAIIHLVRHAQASFGSRNYDELSAIGRIQAGLLGRWIGECGSKVDQVVAGGLVRHKDTAQFCVAKVTNAPWDGK
jgi:hypothetical protein